LWKSEPKISLKAGIELTHDLVDNPLLWQNIKSRSYVIQGGRDDLVPPGNADFLEKNLRQVPLTVVRDPAMDHFVPWAHPDLIEAALLDALAH
ncbi:MAG TPA: alpha/beta hydrolase, partial [Leptospiraceae bacterium]|nr:alpha/beta hydrolase [Leptospiraceae bacterium]